MFVESIINPFPSILLLDGLNVFNLLKHIWDVLVSPKALLGLLLILLTAITYLNGLFFQGVRCLVYSALLWQFLVTTSCLKYPTRFIRTKSATNTKTIIYPSVCGQIRWSSIWRNIHINLLIFLLTSCFHSWSHWLWRTKKWYLLKVKKMNHIYTRVVCIYTRVVCI